MKSLLLFVIICVIIGAVYLFGTGENGEKWSHETLRENLLPKKTQTPMENYEREKSESKEEEAGVVTAKDSQNPQNSWDFQRKSESPVDYMNEMLVYLTRKRKEISATRTNMSMTLYNWQQKQKNQQKLLCGKDAVLREAVLIYLKAEKGNEWPVDFAYRSYGKNELQFRIVQLEKELKETDLDFRRVQRGVRLLQDSVNKSSVQLQHVEHGIRVFQERLELFRNGTLSASIDDFIKELDKLAAEQTAFADDSIKKAQDTIFAGEIRVKSEVSSSFESILKQYGNK